jgi:hypothetical protein
MQAREFPMRRPAPVPDQAREFEASSLMKSIDPKHRRL